MADIQNNRSAPVDPLVTAVAHDVNVEVGFNVKEGRVTITGEEVAFSFTPLRPRHIKLAFDIQLHIRNILAAVREFRESNQ